MGDDHHELEEGTTLQLDFGKLQKVAGTGTGAAVLPAVAQDADSGEVLIVAYANEEAVRTAIERKQAVFWSTSRNELWIKGATSGDTLDLVELRVNCEQNSIIYLVRPAGEGACHTRDPEGKTRRGCYYRRLGEDGQLQPL